MKIIKIISLLLILSLINSTSTAQSTVTIKIDGSGIVAPIITNLISRYKSLNPNITIDNSYPSYGSYFGFDRLINGQTDITTMSRAPNSTQINSAQTNGISLNVTKIASDALVIVVSKDNPINNITSQQISDIYNGLIYNWTDLGWSNGSRIKPVMRDKNSAMGEYFNNQFLNGNSPDTSKFIEYSIQAQSSNVFGEVRSDNRAISYGNLGAMLNFVNLTDPNFSYKIIPIDTFEPIKENVIAGNYPFVIDLFLVFDDNSATIQIRDLVNYMLTPEGQYIINRKGYIPISTPAVSFSVIGGFSIPFDFTFFVFGLFVVGIIYHKKSNYHVL